MRRLIARLLSLLSSCVGFCITTIAVAQSPPPASDRLEAFIRVTQFSSPYSVGARFPVQWCYAIHVEPGYNYWYFTDALSEELKAVRVGNAFEIPFLFESYGDPRRGSIVAGYAIDGGSLPDPLSPASVAPWSTDCPLGAEILSRAPYPVVRIATDLSKQTLIDPAPEYHYWQLNGRSRRVRLILAIPVTFQVGANEVAGRIVLAFSGG